MAAQAYRESDPRPVVIALESVTKRFQLYLKPADRLWEALWGKARHHIHTALEEVRLTVCSGETLAVLGRNGAGKSTLLKLICGVLLPDSGRITVDGRTTGLLELGAGFDPRLSGRQNIYVNGLLLGMEREEIRAKEEAIIAFAELGEYIDEPLRTYSSGMVMRLGFAIAAHADPQVLVVDEALAVGDARFQQKCLAWISSFKQRGGAILLASHDLNAVKLIADRAVVLEGGKIVFDGPPEPAVAHYLRLIAGGEDRLGQKTAYGSGEVVIEEVALTGISGQKVISCGERVLLTITLFARHEVEAVSVGFMFRDRFGQDLFGTNSYLWGRVFDLKAGRRYLLRSEMIMSLAPGRYTVTVAAHSGAHHLERCYHWWDNALEFEVAGVIGPLFSGLVRLPVEDFRLTEMKETADGLC